MTYDTTSQKIAQLQLRSRRLLVGKYAGKNASRLRNAQADFEQLREYSTGDDIRFIDWKSSARGQKLVVRTYQEERDRRVFLLVDISRSAAFGSGVCTKQEVIRDCAAMIASAAGNAHDQVGAILFHESVHAVYAPKASAEHITMLMQSIITAPCAGASTAFVPAVQSALGVLGSKSALVIIVSDCITQEYAQVLPALSALHDVVIVRVQDPVERLLPSSLVLPLQDMETQERLFMNSGYQVGALNNFLAHWTAEQDLFDEALIDFFNTRVRR
jgi:uncharacterized protein (DUF58 family)